MCVVTPFRTRPVQIRAYSLTNTHLTNQTVLQANSAGVRITTATTIFSNKSEKTTAINKTFSLFPRALCTTKVIITTTTTTTTVPVVATILIRTAMAVFVRSEFFSA